MEGTKLYEVVTHDGRYEIVSQRSFGFIVDKCGSYTAYAIEDDQYEAVSEDIKRALAGGKMWVPISKNFSSYQAANGWLCSVVD